LIGIFGIVSAAAGLALAYCAHWHRSKAEILETCAGALLIFGLAFIGAALPDVVANRGKARIMNGPTHRSEAPKMYSKGATRNLSLQTCSSSRLTVGRLPA
jgi:hypothetical protein